MAGPAYRNFYSLDYSRETNDVGPCLVYALNLHMHDGKKMEEIANNPNHVAAAGFLDKVDNPRGGARPCHVWNHLHRIQISETKFQVGRGTNFSNTTWKSGDYQC